VAQTRLVSPSTVEEFTPDAQEMLMYFLDVTQGAEAGDPQARVVATTNENLPDRLTAELFRADLFYRLNLVHLTMPRVLGAGDTQLGALPASLSV
jgi:DNA-binding NtrC family response regulator